MLLESHPEWFWPFSFNTVDFQADHPFRFYYITKCCVFQWYIAVAKQINGLPLHIINGSHCISSSPRRMHLRWWYTPYGDDIHAKAWWYTKISGLDKKEVTFGRQMLLLFWLPLLDLNQRRGGKWSQRSAVKCSSLYYERLRCPIKSSGLRWSSIL